MKTVARKQQSTQVVYSLVHSFDFANRSYFKTQHLAANPPELYVWVVSPTGDIVFKTVELAQSLSLLIEQSRQEIQTLEELVDGKETATQRLSKILIAQHLPANPSQLVTYVPQGTIFLVPMAALMNADGRPLIKKHTLSVTPSIAVLQLASKQFEAVKQAGRMEILVVGTPAMPACQSRPDQPATPLKLTEASDPRISVYEAESPGICLQVRLHSQNGVSFVYRSSTQC